MRIYTAGVKCVPDKQAIDQHYTLDHTYTRIVGYMRKIRCTAVHIRTAHEKLLVCVRKYGVSFYNMYVDTQALSRTANKGGRFNDIS